MDTARAPRTVQVQQLTLPAFAPFGTYASLFQAERPSTALLRIEFYRDAQQLGLTPQGTALVEVCIAQPRTRVIDALECVNQCVRGLLPIDGDMLLQVAPASAQDCVRIEELAVFYVPRFTLCTILPGIWHYSPYPVGTTPVHALLVQPECVALEAVQHIALAQWQRTAIQG